MSNRPHALLSERYAIEEEALKDDPILQEMAREFIAFSQTLPDVPERWEFMRMVSAEYDRRGGQASETIGGPARAFFALVKEATDE